MATYERITRTYDIERNETITRRLVDGKSRDEVLKAGSFRLYGRTVTPPQTSIHPRNHRK